MSKFACQRGFFKVSEVFSLQKLSAFGLADSVLKNVIFVTDQGGNLISALRSEKRLNCSAHLLNNVMKHVMNSDSEEMEPIKTCVDNCKELVAYVNQSSLKNVSFVRICILFE